MVVPFIDYAEQGSPFQSVKTIVPPEPWCMQALHSRSILFLTFAAPFASAAFAFPATPPSRIIRPPPPLGLSSSNIGSVLLPTLSLRLGPGAAARTARKKARMSALDASSQGPFGKGYAPDQEGSEKLHSGPAERNTPPIIEVLKTCMPASGKVLGVAEGSGQHVSAFAKEFPGLEYQPTEIEESALRSISVYTRDGGFGNILPPLHFDCIEPNYEPLGSDYSVMYTINLTHISPWEATVGFFKSAKKLVKQGGLVFIYGPFKVDGGFTSEGNEQFDQKLRARDSRFGYRDITEVSDAAASEGIKLDKVVDMPANNHMLLFTVQ